VFKGQTDPVRAVLVVLHGLPRRRRRRTACQGCWGLSPSRWHGPDWIGFLFVRRPLGSSPRRLAGVRARALAVSHAGSRGGAPAKSDKLAERHAWAGIEFGAYPEANRGDRPQQFVVELSNGPAGGLAPAYRAFEARATVPSAGPLFVCLEYHHHHVGAYPLVPFYPRQNCHQGRAGAALRAVCANNRWSWSISPARMVSCSRRSATWPFSSSTRALPSDASAWSSPVGLSTSTIQRYPCGVAICSPVSNPLRKRRLIVCSCTDRAIAASFIDNSMSGTLAFRLINCLGALNRCSSSFSSSRCCLTLGCVRVVKWLTGGRDG